MAETRSQPTFRLCSAACGRCGTTSSPASCRRQKISGSRSITGRARLDGPNRLIVGDRVIEADRLIWARTFRSRKICARLIHSHFPSPCDLRIWTIQLRRFGMHSMQRSNSKGAGARSMLPSNGPRGRANLEPVSTSTPCVLRTSGPSSSMCQRLSQVGPKGLTGRPRTSNAASDWRRASISRYVRRCSPAPPNRVSDFGVRSARH